ncbi:MAG: glutathione peroxidase [Proteobacteria bacterium]|nr:glutathione peroxidase [Pseudomonadota bacterium]
MDTGISTAAPGKIYTFEMKSIDGKPKSLADYKGRVMLLVNTASLCGFTPQYDGLEELHKKYKERGLSVLGFPANNFGSQEPGKEGEIKEFCRTQFSIGFDMFSKISVKGADIHPLYAFLTKESGFNGDVPWNFSKFLVGRDGKVAARFGPDAEPASTSIVSKIEELLAAK